MVERGEDLLHLHANADITRNVEGELAERDVDLDGNILRPLPTEVQGHASHATGDANVRCVRIAEVPRLEARRADAHVESAHVPSVRRRKIEQCFAGAGLEPQVCKIETTKVERCLGCAKLQPEV